MLFGDVKMPWEQMHMLDDMDDIIDLLYGKMCVFTIHSGIFTLNK